MNFLITIIKTQSEKSDKRKKLDCCMNLSRARLMQDQRYFSQIFQYLSPSGEKNDDTERFMLLILLSCYKNVYDDQIESLSDYDSIDSLEEENKKLLSLEKWFGLFQEKEKRKLDDESLFLEDILVELQTEFGMYKDIKMAKEKETDPDTSEYDDDYIPIDKPVDLNIHIFGYNLSELPQQIKYALGFSFLSFIMAIIYFLFYYLSKMKNNSKIKNKRRRN